jgi:hypothetical protein
MRGRNSLEHGKRSGKKTPTTSSTPPGCWFKNMKSSDASPNYYTDYDNKNPKKHFSPSTPKTSEAKPTAHTR